MVTVAVYVGLGTNLGDKEFNLKQALAALSSCPGINLEAVSSFYLTEPRGRTDQDWFLNAAARIGTNLAPQVLLTTLQAIEASLGRVREVPWGPRTIDLDILLYGNRVINTVNLTVPHPRLKERAFVLIPLAELAPELILPTGERVAALKELVKVSNQQVLPWATTRGKM
jgi:2-amino-4-hydroxy-6-hydroxymethyldihydropteridine diphosphokinase